MWLEPTPNGKFKACERYEDPLTGKLRKVSVTIEKDTKQARKSAEQTLREKIDKATNKSDIEDVTAEMLTNAYLESKKVSVKPSSYLTCKGKANLFLDIIGNDTLVNCLTARTVMLRIKSESDTSTYTNRKIGIVKELIAWGFENDFVTSKEWLDKIKYAKDDKKARIEDKYLEAEELAALLDSMDNERFHLLTKLLALTGMRISEALVLTMHDIKGGYISVTKTYLTHAKIISDTPKTKDSVREIFIQPELESVLSEIRAFRLRDQLLNGYKTDLLLPSSKGIVINYKTYYRYLTIQAKKVFSKHITPHTLRHTHVSLLAEHGVPFDTIARRLGHHGDHITKEVYFHVTRKLKQADNDKIKNVKIL